MFMFKYIYSGFPFLCLDEIYKYTFRKFGKVKITAVLSKHILHGFCLSWHCYLKKKSLSPQHQWLRLFYVVLNFGTKL